MRPRIQHELITEQTVLTPQSERKVIRAVNALLNGECDLVTLRRRGPMGAKIRKLRDVEAETVNHR